MKKYVIVAVAEVSATGPFSIRVDRKIQLNFVLTFVVGGVKQPKDAVTGTEAEQLTEKICIVRYMKINFYP